jgi:hypothetical protein
MASKWNSTRNAVNEQALYANRIKPWLEKVERAGAPIWWRKIHGSRFSRDMPDILFMIAGHAETIAGAVELKNPDDPKEPTPKQLRELQRIRNGGGVTLVSHDEQEVKAFFSRLLRDAGWMHPALTQPFLEEA